MACHLEQTKPCMNLGGTNKHAGINVLLAKKVLMANVTSLQNYKGYADDFICSVLPESPNSLHQYTPGGLIYKEGGSNMQRVTASSFLLLTYANYLSHTSQIVQCGSITVIPNHLKSIAKCQVGEPYADHDCWERPEDMDMPRTVYKITKDNPGTEVVVETTAALVVASIVFRTSDIQYSQQLFQTAVQDELLWGATWFHTATRNRAYIQYIVANGLSLGADHTLYEFQLDNKHAGINVLLAKKVLMADVTSLENCKGIQLMTKS